jgi:hypothetical protein
MAAKKKKKPYEPVAHSIHLSESATGIDYGGNEELTTLPTDTLSWESDTHAFWIEFQKGKSPFKPNEPTLSGGPGMPTPPKTIKKPLLRPKKYKYRAIISDGNSIISEDPVIIIDNDGGGGRAKRSGSKRKTTASRTKKK